MDLIFLELILVVVVALGLGLWQLWDVNRELKKDRDAAPDRPRTQDHDGADREP
ncbi:hypothetical protein [Halomonas denitrificans]|nr:hypothetical protein [Halomonas denitrificans]